MEIKIKILKENAKLPTKGSSQAAVQISPERCEDFASGGVRISV